MPQFFLYVLYVDLSYTSTFGSLEKNAVYWKIWQENVFIFLLNDKKTTHLTGQDNNLTGEGRTNPLWNLKQKSNTAIYYEYSYPFEPTVVKRSQYFYYQPIFFYNV